MPSDCYFYDVPVYRVEEASYYADRDKYVEGILFPINDPYSAVRREKERANRSEYVGARDHLERSYGGCWRFNEIIGYIRLHFLGSQIRGEYFGVTKKRIVRTRRKVLEWQTWKLAPELDIPADATRADIFDLILKYLADCGKELKGRHIDLTELKLLGPHVDWRSLYDAHLQNLSQLARKTS